MAFIETLRDMARLTYQLRFDLELVLFPAVDLHKPSLAASAARRWKQLALVACAADRWALPAWPPVAALVVATLPIGSVVEIDPDEGIAVAAARQISAGDALYTDIWSDQFPLHTLAVWCTTALSEAVQPDGAWLVLLSGRLVSLGMALLLCTALYRLLRREVSVAPAAVAVIMLAMSFRFVRMAGSIMMGLPAIALAMGGLWLAAKAAEARQRGRALLLGLGAGLVLASSLLTKPIAWFAPILALLVVVALAPAKERIRRPLAICFGIAAGLVTIGLATRSHIAAEQILTTGWGEATRAWFAQQDIETRVRHYVWRDSAMIITAVLGMAWIGARSVTRLWKAGCTGGRSSSSEQLMSNDIDRAGRRPVSLDSRPSLAFVPVIWLLAACLSIAMHRPIWWHHFLLVSVPLAWLAGYGADALWQRVRATRSGEWRQWAIGVMAMLALLALVFLAAFDERGNFRPKSEVGVYYLDRHVTQRLRRAPPGPIFADRPIYALAANRRILPRWAMVTEKRLRSDPTMASELAESLEEGGVSAVVLARWTPEYLGEEFAQWLEREFVRVGREGRAALYVRREERE